MRLLIVEDDRDAADYIARAFREVGHVADQAPDGEEGLAAIANGGEFDVVVSDVVMPGMDGPAMVRAIRRAKPEIPVLFMSGYAEEQLRSQIDLSDMYFIAKPFSVQQIGDKVGQVLAAKRQA